MQFSQNGESSQKLHTDSTDNTDLHGFIYFVITPSFMTGIRGGNDKCLLIQLLFYYQYSYANLVSLSFLSSALYFIISVILPFSSWL